MKLVDVHCHLDNYFYPDDIDRVMKNCKKNNCIVIPAGVDPDTNRQVLELQTKYPNLVFPSLGLYPRDALYSETDSTQNRLKTDYSVDKELKFIEKNSDKIVAIGEIGMDFKNGKDKITQEKEFRKCVELAIKLDKAVVIHSRKAEKEIIEIMEEYVEKYNYKKVVMHCFGGKTKLVQKIREYQWYFSVPTNIVRDEHFQKLVKETPMHLLLTETDSPFLSPLKEQKNEPSNVIETIKMISKIKRLPIEDVSNIIYRNAKRVFGF